MTGKTILVTGAAGFIGSHTASALIERGDRVVGLDNLNDYYDPARKRVNLQELAALPGAAERFTFVEGDIRDRALLRKLFGEHSFTAVAHLAAMAGVRVSVDDPWLYYDVNLTGTLNLLDAGREHGQPNFVLASTSSAYGNTKEVPFVETDSADRPLAPYPASKRSAELLGHSYHHIHGTDFTALRFFTVYGPRGRPDMLAYKLLDAMRLGEPMPLYNGGQMYRDWTFVTDIVQGVVAATDRRLGYEIINIGRGEPVLLSDFVKGIEALAGRTAPVREEPMMRADVSYTYANIEKARALLGYDPKVSVADGAQRFYDWYCSAVGEVSS
ncbi:MAG: SDR family NAD(P)-dependent oxidoreductase [Myxococcales bacterium]|nr:MAG: SDR family NAD(P)-dependent oxidoreductase [Myxococcales bacterium]